eukprot:6044514-Amphidinium_carterae.1
MRAASDSGVDSAWARVCDSLLHCALMRVRLFRTVCGFLEQAEHSTPKSLANRSCSGDFMRSVVFPRPDQAERVSWWLSNIVMSAITAFMHKFVSPHYGSFAFGRSMTLIGTLHCAVHQGLEQRRGVGMIGQQPVGRFVHWDCFPASVQDLESMATAARAFALSASLSLQQKRDVHKTWLAIWEARGRSISSMEAQRVEKARRPPSDMNHTGSNLSAGSIWVNALAKEKGGLKKCLPGKDVQQTGAHKSTTHALVLVCLAGIADARPPECKDHRGGSSADLW